MMSGEGRDVRLDFFRGLALIFIFVDHIPDNLLAYTTLGNVVFSDAAEVFVFISGYTAAVVFGGLERKHGMLFASVQVLRRCWSLYVAHIFVFIIFTAQVSWTAERTNNQMFAEEMGVVAFLAEPHIAVIRALSLSFQPAFMNILPLYIVLLATLAVLLPLIARQPRTVLIASAAIYVATQVFRFNPSTYPAGVWFFNPLAWQLLFLAGAILGRASLDGGVAFLARRDVFAASCAILALCVAVRVPLTILYLLDRSPAEIVAFTRAIGDKTGLGPLRLINFLALAHVVATLVRRDSRFLAWRWSKPVVVCGRQSLAVFCLGIFLSYAAHVALTEVNHSFVIQLSVTAAGVVLMYLLARILDWSKTRPGARPSGRIGASAPGQSAQGGK